jgi:hypothetical protein
MELMVCSGVSGLVVGDVDLSVWVVVHMISAVVRMISAVSWSSGR